MFPRSRRLVLIGATAAALGAIAPAAASAAAPVHKLGTAPPPVMVSQPTAVAIEAFPTGGKGSGSETTCGLYTQELQADQAVVDDAKNAGDYEAADKWTAQLNSDIDSALDAGCAVIY
jgi:hypothetical protein